MILVIDNYDSFVHNLARYFECAGGGDVRVVRNDALSCADIRAADPSAIILSPGPCTPDEAGITVQAVRDLGHIIPILGVCLGHQAIGQAYGLQTVRAPQPYHGKSSVITHNGDDLFAGLPSPMRVGRYHSLIAGTQDSAAFIASGLEILAQTIKSHQEAAIAMAMRHTIHPVYGVQFHPESILSEDGMGVIENFLHIAARWNTLKRPKFQGKAA